MILPHIDEANKGRLVAAEEENDDDENDDKTARALLTRFGFDPDNLNKLCYSKWGMITPIDYFSAKGNFTMIRYLVSRGADYCRNVDDNCGSFPMYYAAYGGHLDIIRFLSYDGGAHDDIRRQNICGNSPLYIALYTDHFEVVYWLIRNRALAPRADVAGGGIIDAAIMRRDFRPISYFAWKDDKRLPILAWAQDNVTNYERIHLFLKGTIVSSSTLRRHPKNDYVTRSKRMKVSPSPLVMFKGKSGILELVAEYVGYPTAAHELRIFRQLIDLLPAFIEDVPFVKDYEDEENDWDPE